MTIVDAIGTRIASLAAVVAIASTRVTSLILPQKGTLPAVRVSLISKLHRAHLRGTVGLRRVRIQVDAVAGPSSSDPYATANALDAAIHGDFVAGEATGLAGWQGTVGGIDVRAVLPEDAREQYLGDELRQVVVSRDYFVEYVGM